MYLVDALVKQGHTVDIWAQIDTKLTNEEYDGIRVFRVWEKSFRGLFHLLKKITKEKPKLVHIQHEVNIFGNEIILPFTPFIAWLIRLFSGKVVTTFHGGMWLKEIDRVFVQENWKKLPPWVIRLAFRYIFWLFSLFSSKIIVHEAFQKDQLLNEHFVRADKIYVIPHWVPEKPKIRAWGREYFGLPEWKKLFLSMGFAARYKGLPELYEAYSEYMKEHNDAVLLLWMSPAPRLQKDREYMDWFHDLEKKFVSLGDCVKYVGFMSEEMMEYAYSASDRVLFPYSRRLAASGPMAIAIWYEKPIVLSNILKWMNGKYELKLDEISPTIQLKKERVWSNIAKSTVHIYGSN